jgi:hypothetical protein
MHIEITYEDGTTEMVDVTLEGHLLGNGQPGHSVASPARCEMDSDFFGMTMAEGERLGRVNGLDGEQSFTWKVIGTDEEETQTKIARWIGILGTSFAFVGGEVPEGVPEALRQEFLHDAQCMLIFLDDPQAEIDRQAEAVGLTPAAPASPTMSI